MGSGRLKWQVEPTHLVGVTLEVGLVAALQKKYPNEKKIQPILVRLACQDTGYRLKNR